jgi:hypothetical protein
MTNVGKLTAILKGATKFVRPRRRPLSARKRTILLFIGASLTAVLRSTAWQHVKQTPKGFWITEVCVEHMPPASAKHRPQPSRECVETEKTPPPVERQMHHRHKGPVVFPDTASVWS